MPGFGFGTRTAARRPRASAATPPSAPAMAYGRTAGYDAGTAGDWYVDGVNGLDSNVGTSSGEAFKTVSRAVAVAIDTAGSKTIRVMGDGVRYREKVNMVWTAGKPLAALTIASYGTDRPWISGANVLTGFESCTSADEVVVGSGWSSVHKATVAAATIAHTEYWRVMLREDGAPLDLAALRHNEAVPRLFIDSAMPMFADAALADLTMSTNPTWYHQISHPSVLGAFTDGQLAGTVAAVRAYPNVTGYIRVASAAAGVLTLAANSLRPNSAGAGAYALLNVIPAIAPGGWAYKDNGDGTVTFYVWPNDPANLAGGIEIAARKEAAYFYREEGKSLTVDGLGFEMTSCTATDFSSGALFFTAGGGGVTNSPLVVRQCHVRHFDGGPGVTFKFHNNVRFEDSTIEAGRGFGMQVTPVAATGVFNYRVARVLALDTSQTGFRCFGLRASALVDCKGVRTSSGGHANSINFYQGCDRTALVRFVGGYEAGERLYAGYGTNQASSRLLFLHCVFPMAGDGRAFVDQTLTGDAGPGSADGDFQMVNCWTPHEPALAGGGTPGFVLGRASGGLVWEAYNNVAPNISAGGGGNMIARKNNVLTKGGAVAADPSETVADYSGVYADAAGGDFGLSPGSALAAKAGLDVQGLIAAWEAVLPDVDFRQDVLRRAWDPADPGVGPFGKAWAA